jgi:hypothetical protein
LPSEIGSPEYKAWKLEKPIGFSNHPGAVRSPECVAGDYVSRSGVSRVIINEF